MTNEAGSKAVCWLPSQRSPFERSRYRTLLRKRPQSISPCIPVASALLVQLARRVRNERLCVEKSEKIEVKGTA